MQACLTMQSALCGKATSQVFAAKAKKAVRVSTVVRAEAAPATEEKKAWAPPTLNPATPSPIFGGSTGRRSTLQLVAPRCCWVASFSPLP